MNEPVTLGEIYRDTVTGFVGVATGTAQYLGSADEARIEAITGPLGAEIVRWVKVERLEPAPESRPGFSA